MKNTKKALFTSALSLLLCFSMLVGTTFAWFTDEVSTLNNKIVAGNLDVELYNALAGNLTDDTKVEDGGLFEDITYWEPGVVAYENLTIANEGTLALKYALSVNFEDVNTFNGKGLSQILKVAFVPGGIEETASRAQVIAAAETAGLAGMASFAQNGKLLPKEHAHITEIDKTGIPVETVTYAIVIYWEPSDNDNDWNVNNGQNTSNSDPLQINLGVNLFATQLVAEDDSFGPEYDANAKLPVFGTVEIPTDLNEETYEIAAGSNVIIDLNDNAINTSNGFVNKGNAIVKDGTLVTEDTDGDIWYGAYTEQGAETTFQNVVVESNGGGANIYGSAVWNGGSITTNSDTSKPRHVFYVAGSDGKLDIYGGEFTFNPTNLTRKGSYLVAHGEGAVINVYGGTFGKPSTRTAPVQEVAGGVVNIYGGTFAWDPTDWVATGYHAVENGSNWIVVPDNVDAIVSDDASLDAAITDGSDVIMLGSGTYIIPDSAKGKTLTIIGSGNTVIASQDDGAAEGDCDYSFEGATVTFENVTITTSTTYFPGYARMKATYNNCTINGVYTLYDNSTFNNCTFNVSGDVYNVWTWGAAEATFNGCTFNNDGKAILLYGQVNTKLTVNNCTFNDEGGLSDLKAAIEIGNDYNKSYELIVNNATVNGYEINDKGINTGTTLWGNKNSMSGEKLSVTVDGVAQVWDAAGAANALTSDAENISVKLLKGFDLPISSLGTITGGSGEYKLGGENTEFITIDLNGHKLNITTTYWSNLGAKNDAALFTIKNGTMTSSQATGTWNSYDLTFSNCKYVFENVVFDKAVALESSAVLKNVTINETHDYYALWISAHGQTVEIDGLTINSAGRGIKIDEQYVGTPAKVTLKVSNATFNTAKKAAIMVKSAAGADIVLNNVDISNVASDGANAVWNDSDASASYDLVTVSGGTKKQEA